MTTYKTMDETHLGDNATAVDLAAFRGACEMRQERTGETDEEVTAAMWGTGNWGESVLRECGYESPTESGPVV